MFGLLLLAHSDWLLREPDPRTAWNTAWNWEPWSVFLLGLSALLYGQGVRALHQASPRRMLPRGQMVGFAAGWLSLAAALLSPLHAWSEMLFAAHMTQHEILMLVSAPLLVLGRPMTFFLLALPASWAHGLARWGNTSWRRRLWRLFTWPFGAFLVHALALWLWHIPWLFDATLASESVHALQHASFLFSAILFWWAVIHGQHAMVSYGMAILYMFATALHSGLLGALLTFANLPYYASYVHPSPVRGLTPLEDQQLGGLIMWIPAGLVYVAAGLLFFVGWLQESERRTARWQSELASESAGAT